MKYIFVAIVLFSLFFAPAHQASAQSLSTTETTQITFGTSPIPQWTKDLRRWDIITFGLFPFSLFVVTFTTDMIRWYNAGNAPFSDNKYAPWPFKAAGAVEMSSSEFGRSVLIAAGLSMAVALVDLIIVIVRRNNERELIESLGSSSVTIERTSPEDEPPDINDIPDAETDSDAE